MDRIFFKRDLASLPTMRIVADVGQLQILTVLTTQSLANGAVLSGGPLKSSAPQGNVRTGRDLDWAFNSISYIQP